MPIWIVNPTVWLAPIKMRLVKLEPASPQYRGININPLGLGAALWAGLGAAGLGHRLANLKFEDFAVWIWAAITIGGHTRLP